MLITPPDAIIATLTLGIGCLVLWTNHRRPTNICFFVMAVHVALWLLLVGRAKAMEDGLLFLRIGASVGAALPLSLRYTREVIIGGPQGRGIYLWLLATVVLCIIPFTYWFVPAHSTPENQLRGPGWTVFTLGSITCYAALFFTTLRRLRNIDGLAHIELKLMMWTASMGGGAVIGIMALRQVEGIVIPRYIQPLIVGVTYAVVTGFLTSRRLFDARGAIMWITRWGLSLCIPTLVIYFAQTLILRSLDLSQNEMRAQVTLLTTALGLLLYYSWSKWIAQKMRSGGTSLRRFQTELSQTAEGLVETDELLDRVEAKVADMALTENVWVLHPQGGKMERGKLAYDQNSPMAREIAALGWTTPESISRDRSSPERDELKEFMQHHRLGAIIHQKGVRSEIALALKIRPTKSPYIYPQIQDYQELAITIELLLSQASLLKHAHQSGQLASAGLMAAQVAHEIRNPLAAISQAAGFLRKHPDDTRAAQKFAELIPEPVERVTKLASSLQGYARSPDYDVVPAHIHPLIEQAVTEAGLQSQLQNVRIIYQPLAKDDQAMVDRTALVQVMTNLIQNAGQAMVAPHRRFIPPPRALSEQWVQVATHDGENGILITVEDNGPGIPEDQRKHIYEPHYSTKMEGMGLGLSLCRNLTYVMDGKLNLSPYEKGKGANFELFLQRPAQTRD